MEEVSAIGVYNLFDIDPLQDMVAVSDTIASLITLNLAVLSDVHHLNGTDAVPLFPELFKSEFPSLFENLDLSETVYKCYERAYIYLRNEDASTVESTKKREMERVREVQLENLKKTLDLINEKQIQQSMEDKLRKYASERFDGISYNDSLESIWDRSIEKMSVDDIPFFQELLGNVTDRRLFKKIDRRISELHIR